MSLENLTVDKSNAISAAVCRIWSTSPAWSTHTHDNVVKTSASPSEYKSPRRRFWATYATINAPFKGRASGRAAIKLMSYRRIVF